MLTNEICAYGNSCCCAGTVSLAAPRGKAFSRFLMTVEPAEREEQGRRWAGSFQLFGDSAAQFAPSCMNAVSEGEAQDPAPLYEVQVMWRAPNQGSGCVRFKYVWVGVKSNLLRYCSGV